MSKYAALWEYVCRSGGEDLCLTFSQIQEIAGTPLDHSFLQAKRELAAYGWRVGKISMKGQTVDFHRLKE